MAYNIETKGELEPFLHQEWLLTNHLGSFASGTVVGCNTRRYHGLFCAALHPPVARHLMLSHIGEIVQFDGQTNPTYELAVNLFEQQMHPRGDRHLVRFELGDTAKWTYQVESLTVEKELLLCWRRNICGLRYCLRGGGGRKVHLELLPFMAMRDFHSLRRGTDVQFQLQSWGNHATITDYKLCLHLTCEGGAWQEMPYWWYGHVYPVEAQRGLDCKEELWNPGRFVLDATGDAQITLWASTDPIDLPNWEKQLACYREAKAEALKHLPAAAPVPVTKLWRAADDFVVEKTLPGGQAGKSILAGYPWFADWGRDTMIALPGLLLATGRMEAALEVLEVFARHVDQGMIPNRFDDYTGEPHYNTVDASLWFIHAAHEYLRISQNQEAFARTLLPACQQIVRGYRQGTRFNIHMDPGDGLIVQGDANTQLTWMDAKCDGIVFTPRKGKPVEINALWYHSLVLLGETQLAQQVKDSFLKAFWVSPFRGLADVVNSEQKDGAIRPNQIFAVSLPNSPLTREQQQAVVEVVRRELLTPYGLRTLARGDAKYCGRYEGGHRQRDGAYHNGTVWPWLIGPFLEAYLRVNDFSPAARAQAGQWLAPLLAHVDQACLGQICEVFDGDVPQRPGGCFAQAWSVGEVLRLALLLGS